MTETRTAERPRRVTMAAGVAIGACALLVLVLFDAMSRVRSIEVRQSIDDFLSKPPGSQLGLSAEQAINLLRALMLFNGAVAAAATVLAVYVLRRHNAARVGFSVAAVVLLFTASFSAGALPVLIAIAAAMLWTRPSRDWFAGRAAASAAAPSRPGLLHRHRSESEHRAGPGPAHRAPTDPVDTAAPDAPPSPIPRRHESGAEESHAGESGAEESGAEESGTEEPATDEVTAQLRPPVHGAGTTPPATHGFGNPAGPSAVAGPYPGPSPRPTLPDPSWAPPGQGQAPAGYPVRYPGPIPGPAPDTATQTAGRRPVTVVVAAALTWLFAGTTALAYLLVVAMILFAKDQVVKVIEQRAPLSGTTLTTNDLIATLWVVSAVVLVWCLAAVVLAFLALRRVAWARILLVVSAAVSAVLSALAATALPVAAVYALAAVVVVVLLFSGGANAWYSRSPRDRRQGPPSNVW
jgi:hypothetical protein